MQRGAVAVPVRFLVQTRCPPELSRDHRLPSLRLLDGAGAEPEGGWMKEAL